MRLPVDEIVIFLIESTRQILGPEMQDWELGTENESDGIYNGKNLDSPRIDRKELVFYR
jgi:hypothetical protein